MTPARIRILLVEDNPGDARLLRESLNELEHFPFDLHHVGRLADAREHMAEKGADVILLDLSLPDAHGMESVQQMLDSAGEAPIIVLTGLDDENTATRAVQAGAQDYLIKGRVTGNGLGRSIRYALERKRLEVERAQLLTLEQSARARAEHAVQARDEVLRVVAHDLGNSMSAVALTASALLRGVPDEPANATLRQGIANIRQLTEQMQRLRQDLLDLAIIEAGRLSIDREWRSPAKLLEDTLEKYQVIAADKAIVLEGLAATDLPMVLMDENRIQQVLANLVTNAVKFTPTGGRITLRVEPTGRGIRFSAADTGVGIGSEHLSQLFDRFWKSSSGNRQGAGLGLAIAKGIVEAHGGTIWAESEAGRGSIFHFELPTGELAVTPA